MGAWQVYGQGFVNRTWIGGVYVKLAGALVDGSRIIVRVRVGEQHVDVQLKTTIGYIGLKGRREWAGMEGDQHLGTAARLCRRWEGKNRDYTMELLVIFLG